jgi:hypothetical protein
MTDMTQSTVPDVPTGGEIMRAIGRLEKSTDDLSKHLGGKIDGLDDKIDGHADRLTRVEGENANLRKDFIEFRDTIRDTIQQRSGARNAIAAAAAGGVSGAVLTAVFQLFHH